MDLTRRQLLAGAAAVVASRHNTHPPPQVRAPLLIGYGVVNHWHAIDPSRFANLLYSAGCTLTEIEYIPWFNKSAREGQSIETDVKLAHRFIQEMRKRSVMTLISLVNWNGEAQCRQEDDWFRAHVREISRTIGPEKVILLGVSEPNGEEEGKAYRWMRYVLEEWRGTNAANGDGGRGAPRISGFDYVDWHHCKDFDERSVRLLTAGVPTINNTDCTPVLNPGPERVQAMARVALKRRAHFLVYGFKDEAVDEEVIRVLGEEIQRLTI
jgi:hypothetical protein